MTGPEIRAWLGLDDTAAIPPAVTGALGRLPVPATADQALQAAFTAARAAGQLGRGLAAAPGRGPDRRRR